MTHEICKSEGCEHPMTAHVHDHVMHEGRWLDVARCIDCERDGGPCTDEHSIVAESETEERAS